MRKFKGKRKRGGAGKGNGNGNGQQNHQQTHAQSERAHGGGAAGGAATAKSQEPDHSPDLNAEIDLDLTHDAKVKVTAMAEPVGKKALSPQASSSSSSSASSSSSSSISSPPTSSKASRLPRRKPVDRSSIAHAQSSASLARVDDMKENKDLNGRENALNRSKRKNKSKHSNDRTKHNIIENHSHNNDNRIDSRIEETGKYAVELEKSGLGEKIDEDAKNKNDVSTSREGAIDVSECKLDDENKANSTEDKKTSFVVVGYENKDGCCCVGNEDSENVERFAGGVESMSRSTKTACFDDVSSNNGDGVVKGSDVISCNEVKGNGKESGAFVDTDNGVDVVGVGCENKNGGDLSLTDGLKGNDGGSAEDRAVNELKNDDENSVDDESERNDEGDGEDERKEEEEEEERDDNRLVNSECLFSSPDLDVTSTEVNRSYVSTAKQPSSPPLLPSSLPSSISSPSSSSSVVIVSESAESCIASKASESKQLVSGEGGKAQVDNNDEDDDDNKNDDDNNVVIRGQVNSAVAETSSARLDDFGDKDSNVDDCRDTIRYEPAQGSGDNNDRPNTNTITLQTPCVGADATVTPVGSGRLQHARVIPEETETDTECVVDVVGSGKVCKGNLRINRRDINEDESAAVAGYPENGYVDISDNANGIVEPATMMNGELDDLKIVESDYDCEEKRCLSSSRDVDFCGERNGDISDDDGGGGYDDDVVVAPSNAGEDGEGDDDDGEGDDEGKETVEPKDSPLPSSPTYCIRTFTDLYSEIVLGPDGLDLKENHSNCAKEDDNKKQSHSELLESASIPKSCESEASISNVDFNQGKEVMNDMVENASERLSMPAHGSGDDFIEDRSSLTDGDLSEMTSQVATSSTDGHHQSIPIASDEIVHETSRTPAENEGVDIDAFCGNNDRGREVSDGGRAALVIVESNTGTAGDRTPHNRSIEYQREPNTAKESDTGSCPDEGDDMDTETEVDSLIEEQNTTNIPDALDPSETTPITTSPCTATTTTSTSSPDAMNYESLRQQQQQQQQQQIQQQQQQQFSEELEKERAQHQLDIKQLQEQLQQQQEAMTRLQSHAHAQQVQANILTTSLRTKLRRKDQELKSYKVHQENQTSVIISHLLFLEGQMQKDQKTVNDVLNEKEDVLRRQRAAIEDLTTKNYRLLQALKESHGYASENGISRTNNPQVVTQNGNYSIQDHGNKVVLRGNKGAKTGEKESKGDKKSSSGQKVRFSVMKDKLRRHKSSLELYQSEPLEPLVEGKLRYFGSEENLVDDDRPNLYIRRRIGSDSDDRRLRYGSLVDFPDDLREVDESVHDSPDSCFGEESTSLENIYNSDSFIYSPSAIHNGERFNNNNNYNVNSNNYSNNNNNNNNNNSRHCANSYGFNELSKSRSVPQSLPTVTESDGGRGANSHRLTGILKERPHSLPSVENISQEPNNSNGCSSSSSSSSSSSNGNGGGSGGGSGKVNMYPNVIPVASSPSESNPFKSFKNVFKRRGSKKKRSVSLGQNVNMEYQDAMKQHFKKYDLT